MKTTRGFAAESDKGKAGTPDMNASTRSTFFRGMAEPNIRTALDSPGPSSITGWENF
jgi:hypothetical protein